MSKLQLSTGLSGGRAIALPPLTIKKTVQLKASPIDGKANQELIQLLAKKFDVPKSFIRIKLGVTSKTKRIEIDDY